MAIEVCWCNALGFVKQIELVGTKKFQSTVGQKLYFESYQDFWTQNYEPDSIASGWDSIQPMASLGQRSTELLVLANTTPYYFGKGPICL